MPFQDIEEESVEVSRTPGTVERWLRKIFVEDFGLKLLSLAITLMVWAAVTSENQPMTIHTAVPLNFVQPDNLAISNDPPRTVEVLLTGSKNKLNNLRLLDLVATVDLSDSKPGERVVRLSRDRVAIELPSGVTIASFQPTTLPIRLEPVARRDVPIDVRLDGSPATGFEVYGTQSNPATVTVSGPASLVNELRSAPTETVFVDGRRESFSVSGVSIALLDQKLTVGESLVDVVVTIGERRTEQEFTGVQVTSADGAPAGVATVKLLGPPNILSQIRAEDLRVFLDKAPSGETTPRLELPEATRQQVKLVSINSSISK